MDRTPVSSSTIKSIGYIPNTKELQIEFNNGAIFNYAQVSSETWQGLNNSESKGKYFSSVIKPHYTGICTFRPEKKPKEV